MHAGGDGKWSLSSFSLSPFGRPLLQDVALVSRVRSVQA